MKVDFKGQFGKNDHKEGYKAYADKSWYDAARRETDIVKRIQLYSKSIEFKEKSIYRAF